MKSLAIVLGVVFLTGCASTNYQLYAEAQVMVAEAQAKADIERYKALAEIARAGDSAAKVAAVMSLNNTSSNKQPTIMRQPESASDTALKWTSVLLPSVTQIYGLTKNYDLAINQSNNSKDIAINSNQTMLGFGRLTAGREIPIVGSETDRLIYPVID